ncbi:MAG: hypothetical protein ACRC28_16970 [Clostridium sp.]|uniref:hypothetical protein n=1 Tax=Clostridium sp. TaxID=1506 RepID=UPI003F3DFF91
MKKLILMLTGVVLFGAVAMGCSRELKGSEKTLINKANELIESKYKVDINEADFTYDLSGVVKDNEFTPIKDGEIPKEVFVRAVGKEKPSHGKLYDYSIKFNTKTNEILSSECLVY